MYASTNRRRFHPSWPGRGGVALLGGKAVTLTIVVVGIVGCGGSPVADKPVPDLTGQTFGEAKQILRDGGWEARDNAFLVDAGNDWMVTSQVPKPGGLAEEGVVDVLVKESAESKAIDFCRNVAEATFSEKKCSPEELAQGRRDLRRILPGAPDYRFERDLVRMPGALCDRLRNASIINPIACP